MDGQERVCTWELESCTNKIWAKNLCSKHYKAYQRLYDTPQRQKSRQQDRDRKRERLNTDPEARQAVRDYNNARYQAQTADEKFFKNLRMTARRTGIPLDDLVTAYTSHDGHCDACGRVLSDVGGPNVHHVHDTNVFAGFLCTNCNIAEGHLGGSSERAYKMYLFLMAQEDRIRKEGDA